MAEFDELVTEAMTEPFSGWDFSWLDCRSWTEPLRWDYTARVATEAWPPNVQVAGQPLLPLGIPVIQDEGARDNMEQNGSDDGGRLPFRDGSLDLICNRHESFLATEVSRVLTPGGSFVTQQVDCHDNDDLAQILGIEMPQEPDSWIGLAQRQVTEAGLVIEEASRADQRIRFADIAAVVFYLKAISWSIPRYSLEKHRPDEVPGLLSRRAAGHFSGRGRRGRRGRSAVVIVGGMHAQFGEDGRGVPRDSPLGPHLLRDRRVGPALGHQIQYLPLPGLRRPSSLSSALCASSRDHLGVHRRAFAGNAPQGSAN